MRRIIVALGLLIGLAAAATAGTWNGVGNAGSAFDTQTPITRAACGYDDRFCPYGRTRSCAPDGRCWCESCRRYNTGPRYYNEPYEPQIQIPFFGGGGDNRQYAPPNRARFRTFNGCPNNYTVQDGLCKPYTGR